MSSAGSSLAISWSSLLLWLSNLNTTKNNTLSILFYIVLPSITKLKEYDCIRLQGATVHVRTIRTLGPTARTQFLR